MALPKAGVELVAEGLSGFVSDMGRANSAVADFGKSGTSAGSAFDKGFGQVITGALRKVGELGVEALLKAGQAVAGFVSDSIGLAGDFEAGMLEFQAVAGKGVDTKGLEEFRDLFIDIGKRLPVSTSEVQQAAIEMIKGGIDPATVAAGGLEQNIQFAAAAMDGDLVAAAEISSKVLGGWADANATAKEKSDFLTHATNQLTKAANASSVDVHELSLGLFNAQGIAKTAGVSFDDLTTTLAALAPRFASSSEAGNSLKNVIARLQPTTKTAYGYMLDLGLITEEGGNKFFDAQGKFVGFQQAAEVLKTSLVGLTEQQKVQYLQQIFGNDAMNAASALAELGADGYQAMADSLTNANGVTENAALKQQGFNTALENAKGSVEALQITVGSRLLPVLTDLLNNVVAPAINTLTDMADAVFGNAEAFNRLSPAAQSIVSTIQGIVDGVSEVISAFDDAGAGSSEFAESIGYLADQLGLPGDLIQDIVSAMQEVVQWFSQASDEGSDLGGVIEDLSGIWEKAIGIVENVAKGYQDIANSVLPIVAKFVAEHGDEISAFFKTAWDSIIQIVNLALDLYNAIVPPVLHAIAKFIDDHGSEIQKVMKGAWDIITSIITGALDTIKGVIQVALDIIHGDWAKAWEDIKGIANAQVTAIGGVITGFLNMIAGLFNTSLADIAATWQHNWDAMVEIAMKIGDRMVAAGKAIIDGVIAGMESNAGAIGDFLWSLAEEAISRFKRAIGMESPAKEFRPIGASMIQGTIVGMETMLPALTSLIDQTLTSLIAGLTKNKQEMSEKLREAANELLAQAKTLAEDINDAIADGFGATASIDRQLAKNLDKFKDVLPQYQQYTAGALKQAEQASRQFLDPTQGAKFFKMRSDQILEYAKLQKDLAEAETQFDRERIKQQMALINDAQQQEINAFNASLKATQSPIQKIGDMFTQLLKGNELIKLPGILDNPLIAELSGLIGQLSQPPANPWANPPASAQQIYNGGSTTPYSSNINYNWNMPIYTNQSPSVMQDSAAMAWASMP